MELCDQSVSQPSAKRESEDFTHVAESEEPTCKRCKLTISDCWNFFTKIGVGKDGSERARCNACRKEFKVEDRLDGTALLIHHIEQCDEIEVEDARQLVNDTEGQSKYPEIFQLVLHEDEDLCDCDEDQCEWDCDEDEDEEEDEDEDDDDDDGALNG
ncbi:hypothetical protein Ahy_B06g086067 [Arachis hypogaea]|uniref:BED-type domain-containing protein n=1 Tax=Arachis hypogaea TaxID=3818 RepID=A0A444YWP6_ARAHY|nr:hypothetical protein Ahy_B06g086067 [Arachis hypogaea]